MEDVLTDCKAIHAKLCANADGRSIVIDPWRFFKAIRHGRSYWGYFRDLYWLRHVSGKEFSLMRGANIDEHAIAAVRAKRSRHRRNAEERKLIHGKTGTRSEQH